jgi:hypothetical protein
MSFTLFSSPIRRRRLIGLQPLGRQAAAGLLAGLMALSAACGGKPFNVKTEVDLPSTPDAARAEVNHMQLQAAAIRDEDYLVTIFDANLPLAGVLPVTVTLTNQSHEAIDLRKAQFEIRGPDGRTLKAADAGRVFKRLIAYYEISTYSKSGYKKSREDFAAYGLDLSKPLDAGQSRQGMVFFIAPERAAQPVSLTLIARRLDAKQPKLPAIELQLR